MGRFGILSSFDNKVVLGWQKHPLQPRQGGTLGEQTEQPYKLLYIKGIKLDISNTTDLFILFAIILFEYLHR